MKNLCLHHFQWVGGGLFDLVSVQCWGLSPQHLAWVSVALSWLLVAPEDWRVSRAGLRYLYWLLELLKGQKGLTSAFSASGVSFVRFWVPGIRTKRTHTWISVRDSQNLLGISRECLVLSGCRFPSRETNASSLFSSSAREAGGFGCLSGKTNTLPQISSSHSPELVLAKTPLSGDSIKAQANHTFEERGPPRDGVDGLGGVFGGRGSRGLWVSLIGDAVTTGS